MRQPILQDNLAGCLELQQIPSLSGKKLENSNPLRLMEGIEDTSMSESNVKKIFKKKERKILSMLESPLVSNAPTLKDKLQHSNNVIRSMKLSKTLDQELISKEEAFGPFWTKSLKETYQRLWLPTETDFQDSVSNSLSTSLNGLVSEFKLSEVKMFKNPPKSSSTISYRSLQFSQQDTMVLESTTYCRKIRIYPNQEQRKLFKKCLGASRYVFNKSIATLKGKESLKGQLKLNVLRPQVMKSDVNLEDNEKWMKEIPYDTRQQAITEAISSYKSNITKLKAGQIAHFNVQYKSKKANSQVFYVDKSALIGDSIFVTRLNTKEKNNKAKLLQLKDMRKTLREDKTISKSEKITKQVKLKKDEEDLMKKDFTSDAKLRFRKRDRKKFLEDNTVDGTFTVLLTRPNHWYICLPRVPERQPMIYNPCYQSVFLDPGVRSFQTFYSPDGICGKFGVQESIQVKKLAKKHDMLWSKSDNPSIRSKTKNALRRRCAKIRHTRKCIVDNLHNQTASLLTKNFQNIFIPVFDSGKMTKRQNALSSKISRSILDLCHGAFREKLKYQSQKMQRNLYIVNEAFTTKTCGCCGNMQSMEGKKVFKCESTQCQSTIDRDYNGARNICLKSMVHGL